LVVHSSSRLRHFCILHGCDRQTVRFPDLPDWVCQFQTFGIFAAGYLARPLGGTVMPHFGDNRGRKRMFTLSVLLMAIPAPDGDPSTSAWISAYLSVDWRRRPAAAARDAGNARNRNRRRSARRLGIRCRARGARKGWIRRWLSEPEGAELPWPKIWRKK
jgi:hypothetical protein